MRISLALEALLLENTARDSRGCLLALCNQSRHRWAPHCTSPLRSVWASAGPLQAGFGQKEPPKRPFSKEHGAMHCQQPCPPAGGSLCRHRQAPGRLHVHCNRFYKRLCLLHPMMECVWGENTAGGSSPKRHAEQCTAKTYTPPSR